MSYQRGMEEKRQEYIVAEDKARRGNKVGYIYIYREREGEV